MEPNSNKSGDCKENAANRHKYFPRPSNLYPSKHAVQSRATCINIHDVFREVASQNVTANPCLRLFFRLFHPPGDAQKGT